MPDTFTKKKALGQNFLTNDRIPARIAEACGADKSCGVIEIGPGMGILTRHLAQRAAKVAAIEIDGELIPYLNDRFADAENVSIINCDILKCDIRRIMESELAGLDCLVCANLPYYITTPIVMKLLEGEYGFRSITVMVQKEVAERLASKPGDAQYGAVTAAVSYYAEVKRLFNVGAENFSPKPKVDSAVVTITPYKEKPVKPVDEKLFFRVLRGAFAMRRKTLVNSLSSVISEIGKGEIQSVVSGLFSSTVRGEELSAAQLCEIADALSVILNEA